eukprot:TRINITY_DN54249_c0_g1_i1.p1 TRINITY_DN54249_c0_g1~~TRINITY_DN54249_c0_g1_i1.p1  ORF type:complete len:467 (-),score=99.95 TRINITY_DN54249_c0_g1_i1:68-1468(-)
MATFGAAPERGLTARQRKHVYMHSSIFDDEGPTTKSVYSGNRQKELYDSMNHKLRHNNQAPPSMNLPSPADMQCTQNAGHGVVMPSAQAHHQPIEGKSPRLTDKNHLCGEGDPIKVVKATQHKGPEGHIPKEFWKTSVNLQWHDPRNEFSRQRERRDLNAQELKSHELSSEVFGATRNTELSTKHPKQELLADSAHIMAKDSSLDPHHHPGGPRRGNGGYPGADSGPGQLSPRQHAQKRFLNNLRQSDHNTMVQQGEERQAPPVVHDEDPTFADRRRGEKNFSDLFGAKMGERSDVRGNRNEVIWSKSCSFLDTRSEIATRNMGHWKDTEAPAAHRKAKEAHSDLLEYQRPGAPEVNPEQKSLFDRERICADTGNLMGAESEIARRHRMRDHHRPDGAGDTPSAYDRKHQDLASQQIRQGFGVEQAPPPSPRERGSPAAAGARAMREYGLTAKSTKQASLQSSIFS